MLRQTSDWEGVLWGKPDWADRPSDKPDEWLTRPRNKAGTVQIQRYARECARARVVGLAYDGGMIHSVDNIARDYMAPIQLYNPLPISNRAERLGASDLIDLFGTPHNRTITWNHLPRDDCCGVEERDVGDVEHQHVPRQLGTCAAVDASVGKWKAPTSMTLPPRVQCVVPRSREKDQPTPTRGS